MDVVELARELIRGAEPEPARGRARRGRRGGPRRRRSGSRRARRIAREEHRPNLLATLDFGSGGRHLVLSGHLDTKPVGDARWSVDPLSADVDGDRLYGLGSADMKARGRGDARRRGEAGRARRAAGRLSLLFTADEEDGAAYGARHVAATARSRPTRRHRRARAASQSDFDRLHLVSRGIARMRLVARARARGTRASRPGSA